MFRLRVECLEPRLLLSGLVGLPDLSVVDEPDETPRVVPDSLCITNEAVVVSAVPSDHSETEDGNDATVELPDNPAGDVVDQKAVAEEREDASVDSTDSPCDFRITSDRSNIHALTPDASLSDELNSNEAVPPYSDQTVGVVIPPPAASGTSEDSSWHVDTATVNADSVPVRPAVPLQPPVYFSGTSTLSGARWNASSEKLADADALFDVLGLEERAGTASPNTIAAKAQKSVVPVGSVATTTKSFEASSAIDELALRDAAFSQVEWWTTKDEPSPSPAPDLADLPEAITPAMAGEPVAAELVAVNVTSPLGRVHSWYLLGGIGIWQVILSGRGRQRKQFGENLA